MCSAAQAEVVTIGELCSPNYTTKVYISDECRSLYSSDPCHCLAMATESKRFVIQ